MAYTSGQISEILLKADRTMYKIGTIAYNDMFSENSETLDYERDIIYIYKQSVEYADSLFLGTAKLDATVEKLAAKIAVYDFGLLNPVYSNVASNISNIIALSAALNDLTDVTISNLLNNQILRYDAGSGQWVNVGPGSAVRNSQSFIATAGQTIFTTSYPFDAGLFDVYLNGVRLNTTSFTTMGEYQITLVDAASAGDIIDVVIYDPSTSISNPINSLADLDDVLLGPLSNKHALYYNGTSGKWENGYVFVPYTGAVQNVDLGEFGISSGYFQADLSPTQAGGVGRLIWNNTDGTLNLGLLGGNVTAKLAQQEFVRVVNGTGGNVLRSNYQAVKITGAQGQRLQVSLSRADNDNNSKDTIGLIAENINNNNEGFVIISGMIEDINTTGSLQGETWVDGDTLYLSGTTFGRLTNIKPAAPIHTVILGFVVHAHQNQGKIFVKVDNGYEIDELHNVQINTGTLANGQVLKYNATTQLWENNSDSGITGSGASGQVAYWSGTNTQTGSNNLFWDAANSRLGIGTNAPTSRLHVTSTAWNSTDPFVSFVNLDPQGVDSNGLYLQAGAATSGAYIANFVDYNAVSAFYVRGDRSVGIGTTSPNSKLEVYSSTGYNIIRNVGASGSYFETYSIAGTRQASFGSENNGDTYVGARSNNPVLFLSNNAVQMRLFASGNLGVGVSSDSGFRIDVNGTSRLNGITSIIGSTTSAYISTIRQTNTTADVSFGLLVTAGTSANDVAFRVQNAAQSTNFFTVLGNGDSNFSERLGIGSNTPTRRLDITSDGTNWISGVFAGSGGTDKTVLGNLSSGATIGGHNSALSAWANLNIVASNIIFKSNGENDRGRIHSSGNWLIGTSSDQGYRLDVVGTLRSTTTTYLATNTGNVLVGTTTDNGLRFQVTGDGYFSGRLGIGTTTPQVELAVYSAVTSRIHVQNATSGINANDGLQFAISGSDGYLWNWENGTLQFGTNGTERMRLDASGNLLVGGTSVYGATITSYAQALRSGGLGIRNSAGTAAGGIFTYAAGSGSGSTDIIVEAIGFMAISTGGSERHRFFSGGNVGLGTTTDAGFRLDVNGTMRVSGASTITSSTNGNFTALTVSNTNAGTSARGIIQFANDSINAGVIDVFGSNWTASGGGDDVANGMRVLGSGSGGLSLRAQVGTLRFYTGSTERLNIASTGAATFSSSVSAATEFRLNNQSFTRVAITDTGGGFAGGYNLALSSGITPIHDSTGAISGIHYRSPGTIQFYTGGSQTAGTTATERMRIDASGNLGLGVTPSAWSLTDLSAMQIRNGGFYGYSVNEVGVTSNSYYNAGWKYINSSFATQYSTFNGAHRWYNAPSGTAGNAITFTQAMTLDASGNLGLGTTTIPNVAGYTSLAIGNATNGGNIDLQTAGTRHASWNNTATETYFGTRSNTPLAFTTNSNEVARFYANGNFRIGGNAADAGFKLDVNGTMRVSGASTFGGNMTLSLNQNAPTILNVSNTTNNTGALTYIRATSSAGHTEIGKFSATTTAYKIIATNNGYLLNGTVGDLAILNDVASGSIVMAAGGSSTAQWTIGSNGDLTAADGENIIFGTTNGTKLGTATSQKIGFWNATPIVQPTTAVAAAAFVANTGTAVNDASTFDGYTMAQVVKALRNAGLLA